ncbi:hypothetical protein BB559_001813 [Furculomyces boomerangus]|uniref:SET domain-containing protein n=2 Tax=Harpellales TaxID=61421 RepID=A0A2T9Z055_9FUNG|nr:hypothetical protein BB559_001813 [Furculomyces boomerangus]PWA03785.1 hypothetical protein BB558_000078 [Smittium angustum]
MESKAEQPILQPTDSTPKNILKSYSETTVSKETNREFDEDDILLDLSKYDFPPLTIVNSNERGRCVFTNSFIKQGTVVNISPVLIFNKEEYLKYGKFTCLDSYTYKWQNPTNKFEKENCNSWMALALGLGSLFNHEPLEKANLGFMRNFYKQSIIYTATRDIEPNEELCICYGPNIWFENKKLNESKIDLLIESTNNKDEKSNEPDFLAFFNL